MNPSLLPLLVCIDCGAGLALQSGSESAGRIVSGLLQCTRCAGTWPILRSVPRFVSPDNYASNFGFQWNRFSRTQLDSHSGLTISRDRFFATTGWSAAELNGKIVLDAGCGAGRFAEVAAQTGARILAIDFSTAVDAAFENLKGFANVDVLQADMYRLPFAAASFDYVYSMGVLQHTPDPQAAFLALTEAVAPGGRIAFDVYVRLALLFLWPKYWLRPVTKRVDPARLLAFLEKVVPMLLAVSDTIGRIPRVGRKLQYAIPVMNHRYSLKELSEDQLREWAVLDTFDMLTPAYDKPQTEKSVSAWLKAGGIQNGEILRRGFLIARGAR